MKMVIGPALSRRRLAPGFVLVLAFPVFPAFAGRRRARENSAKKFLGSIYERYRGKSSAAAGGVPLTDAQSLRSYFTTGLAALILDDRTEAAKQGEPPVLNRDPFIGHSEWDISELSVDVKETAGFKTIGTVSFLNFGRPEKVALELLRSGDEWRIADVEWNSDTLRGLYRRKAADRGDVVPPTEDQSERFRAPERLNIPVDQAPERDRRYPHHILSHGRRTDLPARRHPSRPTQWGCCDCGQRPRPTSGSQRSAGSEPLC
jgi:hypothetical protein